MEKEKTSDYELSKISLAKKVAKLCTEFMSETSTTNFALEVMTTDRTLTTDAYGNACYGRTLFVDVNSWGDEEDDDDEDE